MKLFCIIFSVFLLVMITKIDLYPKSLDKSIGVPVTECYISLDQLEKNNNKLILIVKDTPLYNSRKSYRRKMPVETPYALRAGSIVSFRGRANKRDFKFFPAYRVNGGVVPKASAKIISTDDQKKLIDSFYPPVNKKAASVSAVNFRSTPIPSDKNGRGGFSKNENKQVDVLRRTQDYNWYYVRYWSDQYNIWMKGWVPAETINLKLTYQVAIDGVEDENSDAEINRIIVLYGWPVYADVALHDLENVCLAITIEDTPTFTYQRYGGKPPEETPYSFKKGTLFNFFEHSELPTYFQASLFFNGSRRGLYIPHKAARMVSAVDKDLIINMLYPAFIKKAESVDAVSFRELPDIKSKNINDGFSRNEKRKVEVLRRTQDYKWFYVTYWLGNFSRKPEGWVPAHTIKFNSAREELSRGISEQLPSNEDDVDNMEHEDFTEGTGQSVIKLP